MNQRHCQYGCRIYLLVCNSDKCTNIPEYRAHIDDREKSLHFISFYGNYIFNQNLVTLLSKLGYMLVTDIADNWCWWQVWDVFVGFWKNISIKMMTLVKWSHDQSDLIWLHVTLAVQKITEWYWVWPSVLPSQLRDDQRA